MSLFRRKRKETYTPRSDEEVYKSYEATYKKPKFKEGDRIRCRLSGNYFITEGKIYTADRIYTDTFGGLEEWYVQLRDDQNLEISAYCARFEPAKPTNEERIQERINAGT